MKKTIIITILIIGAYALLITIINNQYQKQLQQEAQEYKECIIKQSQEQGWIIRSACSSNYKQLDEIANLKYKQIGLDLYLEKGEK
jgi:hypothetical protein